MQPENRENEKPGWDTRAWLVGILGGIAGGSVTAWASYPPLVKRINAAMHHTGAADWISGTAGVLSLLVLPGVLSGMARRKTFLWGLLPLTLFLAAAEVEDTLENGISHLTTNLWPYLLVVGISLILSSGPVSLFRYKRASAQRKHAAVAASLSAQREAASVPQEGVWPPPPDYRQ